MTILETEPFFGLSPVPAGEEAALPAPATSRVFAASPCHYQSGPATSPLLGVQTVNQLATEMP
jgi:hypothetical protein